MHFAITDPAYVVISTEEERFISSITNILENPKSISFNVAFDSLAKTKFSGFISLDCVFFKNKKKFFFVF